MALNPYFLQGSPGEQSLVQDLINEQLKIYGIEVYYIPRRYITKNTVIREVVESEFDSAYPIEAYVDSYEGYGGQGTLLSKFGIEEQDDLVIPPNGYQMTQGFHSFDHPIRLDSFQPHGHLRMNAASLEIFYPETGRTEQISQISNWSATWHHSHIYEPDVAPLLPAGAVLVLKQWYDNTADNPNNPDPDQWVMGGSRTGDEMTHAWLAITHLDDEGYEKLLAEREERESRSLAGQD